MASAVLGADMYTYVIHLILGHMYTVDLFFKLWAAGRSHSEWLEEGPDGHPP